MRETGRTGGVADEDVDLDPEGDSRASGDRKA